MHEDITKEVMILRFALTQVKSFASYLELTIGYSIHRTNARNAADENIPGMNGVL